MAVPHEITREVERIIVAAFKSEAAAFDAQFHEIVKENCRDRIQRCIERCCTQKLCREVLEEEIEASIDRVVGPVVEDATQQELSRLNVREKVTVALGASEKFETYLETRIAQHIKGNVGRAIHGCLKQDNSQIVQTKIDEYFSKQNIEDLDPKEILMEATAKRLDQWMQQELLYKRRRWGARDSEAKEVYLISGPEGTYKIGKSVKATERFKSIATGIPFKLELVHVLKTKHAHELEKAFHGAFDAARVNGEWFELNDGEVEIFKRFDARRYTPSGPGFPDAYLKPNGAQTTDTLNGQSTADDA